MTPSTKKQRQLIGIGCAQLGIDKELKIDMLLERYGEDSTTKISKSQADDFLQELNRKGFVVKFKQRYWTRKAPAGVVRMASPAEQDKIAALAGLIKWRVKDGQALWMKKRLGINRVRTARDAWLVIEGLKKMFENQMKGKYGKDWWAGDYDDPAIVIYIHEHSPKEYR